MKSPLASTNSFPFCRYKIRSRNGLSFQHLRDSLGSADSKGTLTPLDSAVTRPIFLTCLESTLTKNQAVGEGWLWLTKYPTKDICPERPFIPSVAERSGVEGPLRTLPARPRTCTLSPATGRNNHDRSA